MDGLKAAWRLKGYCRSPFASADPRRMRVRRGDGSHQLEMKIFRIFQRLEGDLPGHVMNICLRCMRVCGCVCVTVRVRVDHFSVMGLKWCSHELPRRYKASPNGTVKSLCSEDSGDNPHWCASPPLPRLLQVI